MNTKSIVRSMVGTLMTATALMMSSGCRTRTVYVDRPVYEVPPPAPARPYQVEGQLPLPPAPPASTAQSQQETSAAPQVVTQAPAQTEYVVVQPTPAPQPVTEVITVSPGPGYVWVGGAYEWVGGRWVWYGGHWARPVHHGAVWVSGGWHHVHGGAYWEHGHWR